jgi:hypothetical protein
LSTDVSSLMMEEIRTSETSVENYFTRQYIPEDNSEDWYVITRIGMNVRFSLVLGDTLYHSLRFINYQLN